MLDPIRIDHEKILVACNQLVGLLRKATPEHLCFGGRVAGVVSRHPRFVKGHRSAIERHDRCDRSLRIDKTREHLAVKGLERFGHPIPRGGQQGLSIPRPIDARDG